MSIMTHVGILFTDENVTGLSRFSLLLSLFHKREALRSNKNTNTVIDDYLLHEKYEKKLLNALETFMTVCSEYGFRVHARKLRFFFLESCLCGRILGK